METFNEYCKMCIVETLKSLEGEKIFDTELSSRVFYTFTADDALDTSEDTWDILKQWHVSAAAYWEFEVEAFGTHPHNVFAEMPIFLVNMVAEGMLNLLSQVDLSAFGFDIIVTSEFITAVEKMLKPTEVLW